MTTRTGSAGAVFFLLSVLPVVPAPPAFPSASPSGDRRERILRLLELTGWTDRAVDTLARSWAWEEDRGRVPRGYADSFRRAADRAEILAAGVDVYDRRLGDEALEASVRFFETSAGREFARAEREARPWVDDSLRKVFDRAGMDALSAGSLREASDRGTALVIAYNEEAAVRRLQRIAAAEESARALGRIDLDGDGRGEYATLRELAGLVPARGGEALQPIVLNAAMGRTDETGAVRVCGYLYRVLLPDDASPPGFVHEAGPARSPVLAGGTGRVGTDAAETSWWAYAWPEEWGVTGRRAFFVDRSGRVLRADNEVARWGGSRAPPPDAALARGAALRGEAWGPAE